MRAPGHGYLKVPFARCGDGVARHITAVPTLSIGPFTCVDCGEGLTLRRPRQKRPHFAHRPDSLCGETALHSYAKELLERERTITLPSLVLQEEGISKIVFKGGVYEFETVSPEHKVETFQPDAVVTYRVTELAIEFLVSHAVDPEKRKKVLERNLSMVEIDLSGVRAGQLSADELDHAILHSSPRSWIHHRRRAAAVRELADEVGAKRVERGRRLKWHIEKRARPTYPSDWKDEASGSVEQAGLARLVGLDVECGHWFTVSRAIWQAHALEAHVIAPSRQFTPGGHGIPVKGEWPNEHSLVSKLPAWMIRSDLSRYKAERLTEAGYDRASYGSPDHAVWSYFVALARRGQAVIWSSEEKSFFIEPELHGRLHRRVELHRLVTKLLTAVEHPDPERGYLRWASGYQAGDSTPAELVEAGEEPYLALRCRILAIEAMLPSYSRKVTNDLCGLPLEPIRDRNLAAIAADEEARIRKENEAAETRRRHIRRQAEQMLGQDAGDWLARQVPPSGASVIDFAGTGDDALLQAERWLATAAKHRREAIIAAERVAGLRAELSSAAQKAFLDPAKADLFLNTGQPTIGGRHPIDFCDSEEALKFLRSLLPKRR